MRRFRLNILLPLLLCCTAAALAENFDSEQSFRSALAAFKEKNFYSARLLLQEIVLKDSRGEYGDDAQYYLAMTYFYEGDYKTAQFEFKALQRDYPDSQFVVRAAFWNGEAWFNRRQYREALEAHAAFLRKYRENPLCASALYTVGFIYNEQKRYDEAIQEFRRALKDYPESSVVPALTLQLGIAQFNSAEFTEARRAFETLLVKYTQADNLDAARFWLGKSYYAEGKFDDALREFTAVRKDYATSPHAPEALYLAALCRYKAGKPAEAHELLAQTAKDYPKSGIYPFVRLRQAQLYHEQNDLQPALAPLIDITNNHRNHETFAPALELMAEIRRKQGKSDEALATFEALGQEKSASAKSRQLLLRQHADLLYKEGRFKEAADKYTLLTEEFGSGDDAAMNLLLLARAQFRDGRFEASLASLARLEKNFDDSATQAEALFLKAEISYQLGKFTQALQLYARFTKKFPKHVRFADAEMGIGWTYFELKQYARAADHFRKILKSYPESATQSRALIALGACQYNLRDLDGAEASYRRIIDQLKSEKTEYAEAIYQLAWLNFRRNRHTEAGADFQRYAELGSAAPRFAEAQYFLGLCRFHTGDFGEAEQILSALYAAANTPAWIREKALTDLAKTRAARKNTAAARDTYRQLVNEYPETAGRDEADYQIAVLSLRLGDEKTALDAIDALRQRSRNSAWFTEGLNDLADYYRRNKKFSNATTTLNELKNLKTKPAEKLDVELQRAAVLAEQGEKGEATRLIEAVIKNEDAGEETVLGATNLFFTILETGGDFDSAAAHAEKLTERFAENPRLKEELALQHARFRYLAKKYPETREILLPLMKSRNVGARARFMLGETSLAQNDTARALDYFRQVSQKQDAASWLKARFHIGEILFAAKDYEEAAREFSRIAYAENRDDTIYEKALYRAALSFRAVGKQKEFETFRAKLREAFPASALGKELE